MSNPSPQLDSCRRRGPRGQARPARHVAVVQASRRFRATLLLAASVCAALALALAGCGGSSKSAGGGTAASHAPGAGATSSTGFSGDSSAKGSSGGNSAPAGKAQGGGKGAGSTAAVSRLSRFAACMRKNGVNVPPPSTSSKGATLNFKGIDTNTQAYKKARVTCVGKLIGQIRIGKLQIGRVKVKIGRVHAPALKLQPPGGAIPGTSGAESR